MIGSSFPGKVVVGDQSCQPGGPSSPATQEAGACLVYDTQQHGTTIGNVIETEWASACSHACFSLPNCLFWRWHTTNFEPAYGEYPR